MQIGHAALNQPWSHLSRFAFTLRAIFEFWHPACIRMYNIIYISFDLFFLSRCVIKCLAVRLSSFLEGKRVNNTLFFSLLSFISRVIKEGSRSVNVIDEGRGRKKKKNLQIKLEAIHITKGIPAINRLPLSIVDIYMPRKKKENSWSLKTNDR